MEITDNSYLLFPDSICPDGIKKMVDNKHDSTNIDDCVPELVKAWPIIQSEYRKTFPNAHFRITFTHRTPEHQFELFKQGRKVVGRPEDHTWVVTDHSEIVTNCDGYKVMSAHNYYPARAFDVKVINEHGQPSWERRYYLPLRDICKKLNLVWGGDWKSIEDNPHIEVPNYKIYQNQPI